MLKGPIEEGTVVAPVEGQLKYTQYFDPAFPIEDRLTARMNQLKITSEARGVLIAEMAALKVKHPPTWEHCARVAFIAMKMAEFHNIDPKAAFYPAFLHDKGKESWPMSLLDKTTGDLTEKEQRIIRQHTVFGHALLQGVFDFSAEIVIRSHHNQVNGYPRNLPSLLHPYGNHTKANIEFIANLVNIADVFDSLHRINSFHGETRALSGEEVKEKMLEIFSGQREHIEALYCARILSTYLVGQPHTETEQLDAGDDLHASSFRWTMPARTPLSTLMHVQEACALEAVYNKTGCTTRYSDISRHLWLDEFIAAGINVGKAFGELAADVEARKMAGGLYKYAFQAQSESKRGRRGGRINQGIIEIFMPVVIAQHLYDPEYKLSHREVLEKAQQVLGETEREDVCALIEMKRLAHRLSHYDDRTVPEHPEAKTVMDYYRRDLEDSEKATSIAHNREFVNGFPTIALMCDALVSSPYPHLSQKVEEAYDRGYSMHPMEVSQGFLADCIAVALYLRRSQSPLSRMVG